MSRPYRVFLLLAVALSLGSISLCRAAFTDIGATVPGVIRGEVAWGDYDSDGDLDIAVSGQKVSGWATSIYRCDGGVFVDAGAGLPAAYGSSLDWGDYDNDGDLDLAFSGFTGSVQFARIYRNDAGVFTDIAAGLTGNMDGEVVWGDYDNDGDLDLLVAMSDRSRIYRNDRGTFVDIGASLIAVKSGSVAWGDYDNDGDLDLVMTSMSPGVTKIYRNDAGVFTDIAASLVWVYNSCACWGDYDNDGDLDLVLSGNASSGYACRIYRNDGGTFTEASTGLPSNTPGPITWGDFDNDGDLDLAVVSGSATSIYTNDGGTFTDTGGGLLGATNGALAAGDYDSDGDLDLAVMGFFWPGSGSEYYTKVYRNDSAVANTVPTAPTGLDAVLGPDGLTLSWSAASDAQTPAAGLSYNLRIGTTPGGNDIFSGMASSTGLRKIPALGNAQKRLSWKLTGLTTSGTYYYSVQAIDSAFAGSPWATERRVDIVLRTISGAIMTHDGANVVGAYVSASNGGQSVYTGANGLYSLVVPDGWSGKVTPSKPGYWFSTPNRSYTNVTADQPGQDFTASTFADSGVVLTGTAQSNVAWVDYDRDNDLDLAITGYWYGDRSTKIYRNDGGAFTDIGPVAAGWEGGVMAWGDYDNDGDLDLVVAGGGGGPSMVLFRNNGGTFEAVSSGLPSLSACALAWGDYDNDGDLDLALTGENINGINITKVYRNTGGTFADSGAVLTGARYSSIAWGDYDNDGDLDLAFSGAGSKIYRNDDGTFVDIGAGLLSVQNCVLAWGDYDSDGDLDLALSGWYAATSGSGPVCKIYRNDGGAFTDIAAPITGIYNGKIAWGDIDNDGDLDLALTGAPVMDGRSSAIYRNNKGKFQDIGSALPALSDSSLAWGDYDNDGDLDLAITGNLSSTTAVTRIYRNDSNVHNSAPTPPTGLSATFGPAGLTLNWAASTDAQTFDPAGLSYNVRVGTSPGASDVFSGMASSSGFRSLPAIGNAQKRLSWTIKGLSPTATYHWSVQAIDPAFAGSSWAGEQAFTPPDVTPPTITLFLLSPTRVAPGDSILATVGVTDNVDVTSVTIGTTSLARGTRNIWTGTIPAPSSPGDYTITVTAWDAAGNTSTAGADCSTQRVIGLLCRDAVRAPISARTDDYLFKLWGAVSGLSGSGFTLNDGSGVPLTVNASGISGLADGDYVSVRGILNTSGPALTATPDHVRKQTTGP